MRLRTRFGLILGAFSLVLTAIAVGVVQIVVVKNAIWTDQYTAGLTLNRAIQVLKEQQDTLLRTTIDWASFHDSYTFAEDRNPRFVEANLADGSLSVLRLDVIAIFGTNREPLAVKETTPGSLASALATGSLAPTPCGTADLLQYASEKGRIVGLLPIATQLWMIAAAPILKSDNTGPSRGIFLMARRMTPAATQRLTQQVGEPMRLTARTSTSATQSTVAAHSPVTLIARTPVQDLCGHDTLELELALPRPAFGNAMIALQYLAGWILCSAAAITAFAFWVLGRWVLGPMVESTAAITRSVTAVAHSHSPRHRVEGLPATEVASLVDAINAMLDTLDEYRNESVQAQKLAALGTMAVGIAHEVNNPNSVINMNASLLRRWLAGLPEAGHAPSTDRDSTKPAPIQAASRAEMNEALSDILTASERIAIFIASLKRFAAPSASDAVDAVSINEVIQMAAHWLKHEIKVHECRLELRLAADIPTFQGRVHQLEQVFVNLLQNAAQASSRAGTLIEVTSVYDEARGIVVCVRDEGCGIAAENMGRIFAPFFTTRRESGGTGLGLSVSQSIVQTHGGTLRIESEPGKGTKATLSLPAHAKEAPDAQ